MTVPFPDAPSAVESQIETIGQPAVIGVTGPTGSGKTTLAGLIRDRLQDAIVLSTDRYLPDYDQIPDEEVDDPEHAALDELAEHLNQLRSGTPAELPVWSFHSHSRTGSESINPAAVIILEGIFALHEKVCPGLDLAIFVEARPEVRWERVKARELSGARGWGVERSRVHFDNVADPTFLRWAQAYRDNADIIVTNESSTF